MDNDLCNLLQMSSICIGHVRWKSGERPYKRNLNAKVYVTVEEFGIPIRKIVANDPTSDCKKAVELLYGLKCRCLLANANTKNF